MTTQSVNLALSLGDPAPDVSLPATDGQRYSLASFRDWHCVVVVFLANHCPYVGSWEDRLIALAREYDERDVAFVAISSSDAATFPADSFDRMRERAEAKDYPFPYLYDEVQLAARIFGATRTPEVFVFDQDGTLQYHGAIDSDFDEGPDTEPYLRNALEEILAGATISLANTPPVGCSLTLREQS